MDGDVVRMRTRRELLAAGATPDELRRWLQSGDLVAVRRGSYVDGRLPDTAEARHLLQVRAALNEVAAGSVVSHASAAVLHGFPTWAVSLDRVHLTRARRSGARMSALVHVHAAALDPGDVVELDGVRVTSAARTFVDLGRTLPFDQALVVADGALFLRSVTPAQLQDQASRAQRRTGAPTARRVIAFADARSESPGESLSRIRIAQAALPAPVPQLEITCRGATRKARVDFGWEALRTVGEFDGRVKYGRLLRPGEQPGDVVWAEKVREDALRAEGFTVVRWTWADLSNFTPTADRLRRAFG